MLTPFGAARVTRGCRHTHRLHQEWRVARKDQSSKSGGAQGRLWGRSHIWAWTERTGTISKAATRLGKDILARGKAGGRSTETKMALAP